MEQLDFLELIETYRAEDASNDRLFKGEGKQIRNGVRPTDAQYRRGVIEAATLYRNALTTRRGLFRLQEAMSTSDFPQLFGDVLDRSVLANYSETPVTWPNYVKRSTVRDFRTVKRFRIDGGETILEEVKELAPYPAGYITDDVYSYSVKKYGRRMPFSWETMINDDLNALQDIPQRMGRASRRSEERFAATLFCDANGPHASVYTTGNKNIINTTNGGSATNPPLSISAFQDAWAVLGNMVDSGGDPITIETVELVVGSKGLEITANNILNSPNLLIGADSGAFRLMPNNWMKGNVRVNYNPYVRQIITTGTRGDTSWFLFANPGNGRPALEMGFLLGNETPQMWMKEPNARRIGGGTSDPMAGDFDTDSIEYKVRHVFGGVVLDPKMTVASNGTGS